MQKVPDIVPVTELREDAAAALQRLRTSRKPIVITQRSRAVAVLLSIEDYERTEHERDLLRFLAREEQQIAKNEGYDLASVLAEADRLLAQD
ncbi:MAG: type II toxin-antitoxin system Phd/YefM family antitoxin [Acidobacteriota bacterium]